MSFLSLHGRTFKILLCSLYHLARRPAAQVRERVRNYVTSTTWKADKIKPTLQVIVTKRCVLTYISMYSSNSCSVFILTAVIKETHGGHDSIKYSCWRPSAPHSNEGKFPPNQQSLGTIDVRPNSNWLWPGRTQVVVTWIPMMSLRPSVGVLHHFQRSLCDQVLIGARASHIFNRNEASKSNI